MLHTSYIKWFRKVYSNFLCWHAGCGHGDRKGKISSLIAMGYSPGIPDLFIPTPPNNPRKELGLFLEFKIGNAPLRLSQKDFLRRFRSYNFCFYVTGDIADAIEVTFRFFNTTEPIELPTRHQRAYEKFLGTSLIN